MAETVFDKVLTDQDVVNNLTSGSTNPISSGAVYNATKKIDVGTKHSDVNTNSSCVRIGNLVICNIRYDKYAAVSLYTNLPTAYKTAYGFIWEDTTHWGQIYIAAGETSLTYTNKGTGANGAKVGQLIYTTSDAMPTT